MSKGSIFSKSSVIILMISKVLTKFNQSLFFTAFHDFSHLLCLAQSVVHFRDETEYSRAHLHALSRAESRSAYQCMLWSCRGRQSLSKVYAKFVEQGDKYILPFFLSFSVLAESFFRSAASDIKDDRSLVSTSIPTGIFCSWGRRLTFLS